MLRRCMKDHMGRNDDQSVDPDRVAQGLEEYSAQRHLAAIVGRQVTRSSA